MNIQFPLEDVTVHGRRFESESLTIDLAMESADVSVSDCYFCGNAPYAINVRRLGSPFGRFLFAGPQVVITGCQMLGHSSPSPLEYANSYRLVSRLGNHFP